MSVSLKVKIFDNSGTRILQVTKSTLTIGSASHCDVVFNEPTVAAEHTRAWLEGGRIWVQDLGGSGGTALNDIRLPALKPMLVRDLDVLRLGESKSTIGLEAVLVRAPVVKPKAAEAPKDAAAPSASDSKAPSSVELEKRKEEAARLAREIADLRLQLQMSALDKASAEDMSQQLQELRRETELVQQQKSKWDDNFRKLESEKQNLRKEIDKELLEFKANALKDLKKVVSAEAEVQAQMLNTQIEKLRAQNEQLEGKLRDSNEERQSLLNRMEENENTQTREINSEVRILNEQKAKLSENLRKVEVEREALRSELKQALNAGEDVKKLSDQKAKLSENLRKVEAEREALRSELKEALNAGDDVRKLAEQKSKLNENLRKVEAERDQLRTQLKQSEAAHVQILRKAEDQGGSLAEKLRLAQEELQSLHSRLDQAETTHSFEVNAEIKKLNEQRAKLSENLKKAESERDSLRAELRKAESHHSTASETLRKLEQERETLRAKMEQSQVTVSMEHSSELKKLSEQKGKLSDSIKELKAEYDQKLQAESRKLIDLKSKMTDSVRQAEAERDLLRKALDKEQREANSLKQELASQTNKMSQRQKANAAMEEDLAREVRRAKRNQARASANTWRTVGMTSLIVALVLAGVWYGSSYFRKIGSRTLSSIAAAPMAAVAPPHKPEKPKKFEPKVGKKYRSSYTENVLYLENYVAAEENNDFRRKWLGELSRTATNEWKVDAWSLSPIGVEELAMIRELERMRASISGEHQQEGIEKMRERENKFLHDLEAVFKTREGVERFLKFKRGFYQRNQAYLKAET